MYFLIILRYWILRLVFPLYKLLVHRVTGLCEIERAIVRSDYQQLGIISACQNSLEDSILRSKRLPILTFYLQKQGFGDLQLDELIRVKRIQNASSKIAQFRDVFKQIEWKNKAIHDLNGIRQTKFDTENPLHEAMLKELWNLLQPEKKFERLTNLWIDIGFQGQDPSTDFRGAGILGLQNLLYFCKNYPSESRKALEDSQQLTHQYFFCSAGLYITLELFTMLKNNQLRKHFYTFNDPREKFDEIFSYVFNKFNQHFIVQPNASFMQFNTIIKQFFLLLELDRWMVDPPRPLFSLADFRVRTPSIPINS